MTASRVGLVDSFAALYGRGPSTVWRAPGRVNLIGEHTDYNDGFVLPIALQLEAHAAAAPRDDGVLRVASLQQGGVIDEVRLTELVPGSGRGWTMYAHGAAWALQARGVSCPGADLLIDSDVPRGAGLSSSAALECAVVGVLVELQGSALSAAEAALTAQQAENDFVGMPCGIMDQFASTSCRAGHALLLDSRTLEHEHVPFPLSSEGLTLLVVDTRAPHRLVDGQYADRRLACRRAADQLGVRALRDVKLLDIALERLADETLRPRVRHVVSENARVLETVELLRQNRIAAIGPLLTASHESLRDDFEVSCLELDVAVEAMVSAGALGARMTGGGFGGSAIGLVPAELRGRVEEAVSVAFAERSLAAPEFLSAVPSEGAGPWV